MKYFVVNPVKNNNNQCASNFSVDSRKPPNKRSLAALLGNKKLPLRLNWAYLISQRTAHPTYASMFANEQNRYHRSAVQPFLKPQPNNIYIHGSISSKK